MIIVTGGAGFIGSNLISRLNSEGYDKIICVDTLGSESKWKNLVGKKLLGVENKKAFLESVNKRFSREKVDAIFHMGASSSTTVTDADYLLENNYQYSVDLARFAAAHGARFIYASSASTYGDGDQGFVDNEAELVSLKPLNAYGFSKYLFDLWLQTSGLLQYTAGLKFFNVYGPHESHKKSQASMVLHAYRQVVQSGVIKLFKSHRADYKDGEQLRDFVSVDDCVNVMMWLFEKRDITGIYNVGAGAARSWNDLARAVFAAMNRPEKIEYIEMPASLRSHYQYYSKADLTKLRAAGYDKPSTSLEDGVKKYVEKLEAGDSFYPGIN